MFSNYTIKTKTFDFKPFYKKFSEVYPNLKQPSREFLEWFIGFSEGEGSFIVAKRGDLSFVVVQSTNDIQILNYIKDTLGFGRVVVQSSKLKTHRFIVSDIKNLFLICLLFIFLFIFFNFIYYYSLNFYCDYVMLINIATIYKNPEKQKESIMNHNIGKAGVYR
jgi:hypothetical protein